MYTQVRTREAIGIPGVTLLDEAADNCSLSYTDLQKILGGHRRYLTGQPGTRAKLGSMKLDGLDMRNWDLSEADLSGTSLVGANLRGVHLSHASLYCADLRFCDLSYAHLDCADLRGVSFKGARLACVTFDNADLRAASTLQVGDKPRFKGNAHDEAPFGSVDFSNCLLRKASFRNARLYNANFTDAILEGANFDGARLGEPCFRGAILDDVDLDTLNVPRKVLRERLPPPSIVARERANHVMAELEAHHAWFVTSGKRGRPAVIDGEDIRPFGGGLKGLCLAGLSARNTIAVGVDFSGCLLQAAHFEGADLRTSKFVEADLSGASMQRSKLAHADFRNARIHDLVLCSGQVLPFQADSNLELIHQFASAHVGSITVANGFNGQLVKAA
jgi:uncharacterized protein YjbI with pentapeptide repeats